jgi:adenylate cyclase
MEVGRKLDANYVIEGSVRHVGNQIRVTAQLINAADGNHVWSQNYERDATVSDLLAIQDEVAAKISGTLGGWSGSIAATEAQRSRSKPVAELSAYECMAQSPFAGVGASEPMRRARTCLESLVRREPNFAEGWAVLTGILIVQRSWGFGLDPPESEDLNKRAYLKDLATQAARRAVDLAPQDPLARSAFASAYFVNCDRDQLRVEAERAIALNPNDPFTLARYGNYIGYTGLWDVGVPLAERGISLAGTNAPQWWWYVVWKNDWFHGRYNEALQGLQKSYDERYWLSHLHLHAPLARSH